MINLDLYIKWLNWHLHLYAPKSNYLKLFLLPCLHSTTLFYLPFSLLHSFMLPICFCRGLILEFSSELVIFKLSLARKCFFSKKKKKHNEILCKSEYIKHLKSRADLIEDREISLEPLIPSCPL